MPASSKQNENEGPEEILDSSTHVKYSLAKYHTRKLKNNRKSISLIILMFSITSLIITLMANSGLINWTAEPVDQHAVDDEQTITLDDIKAVNTDLKKVFTDLKAVSKESNGNEQPIKAKKTEIKSVPVVSEPVKVTSGKEKIKTKQIITVEKKTALEEKKSVEISDPVPVDKSDVVSQHSVESAEEDITVRTTQPDYIKYDVNGNRVDESSEKWVCVQDTTSGLMWEVKTNDNSLRNTNNLYTWFDPNTVLKGKPDGGRCKGEAACDTSSYIQAMNKQNFCGHDDWRLPTREEMMRLVNYGNIVNNVKIDTRYFPETLPSWYWTASTNNSRPDFAWYVLFKNGIPLNDLKEHPKHIRLVRNEPSS